MIVQARALLAILMIAFAAIPGAAADEAVPARGWTHADYGRLVLDWSKAVKAEVSSDGKHLVISFERAANIDPARAIANLKPYVTSAERSRDGKSLTLILKQPVTWRLFADGTKVVVDMAHVGQRKFANGPGKTPEAKATTEKAAAPPAKPAAATAKATEQLKPAEAPKAAPKVTAAVAPAPLSGPKVTLRNGEHAGFSRLAFDWPKDVAYDVKQSGDRVEIHFASLGRIDIARITKDLPPRLRAIAVTPAGNGIVVALTLPPGVLLRDFRSGKSVVVDIYDGDPAKLQEIVVPPLIAAAPEPVAAPSPAAESGAGAAPDGTPPLLVAMPEPAMPKPVASLPEPGPAPAVGGPVMPAPLIAQPGGAKAMPPEPVEVTITAAADAAGGATLSFAWPKPTTLAAFQRGDALWLVFGLPGRGDLAPLALVAAVAGKAQQVNSPFAYALRLAGGSAKAIATAAEGNRWSVSLKPGSPQAGEPIQQRRETLANGGASLLLQAIGASDAVAVMDPEIGDQLVVTPLEVAGLGVAEPASWPDFKLLPSAQGVVVAPLSDRVSVQVLPNGVVITTQAPQVAAVAPAAPAGAGAPMETPTETPAEAAPGMPPEVKPTDEQGPPPLPTVPGLFAVEAWRLGGEATLLADLGQLKSAAIDSALSPAAHRAAQLTLAEFYFANGFAAEAQGILGSLRSADKSAEDDKLVVALSAASAALNGEMDKASADLASKTLQGVPEAALFQAMLAATRGDWPAAAKLFAQPLPDISAYPKPFRTRLRLLAAESQIGYGDPLIGESYLEQIRADAPDPEHAARLAYLDGLRLLKSGEKEKALVALEGLAESPIDEIRAKSQLTLIDQKLADGEMQPKDAIAPLESLRFLWRGDNFEFDLLYKLGQLYIADNQARKGLTTLRQAATHFPDHPLAKQAAAEMTSAFRKLYLEGGADKLSPLTSVALYDEFRELTPAGADGDRMIAGLADRLVKVDLLDGAAALLERQVKFRLSGTDKVAAGTRLAAVRMLDRKPDLALQALKESEGAGMTPALAADRQRLRARALFDTGDTLQGLGLLRDDTSRDALWLKADMLWRIREWPAAADALEKLIVAEQADIAGLKAAKQDRKTTVAEDPSIVLTNEAGGDAASADLSGAVSQAFNEKLARLVLNRAVALSLAGDRRQLKALGRAYGKPMAASPFAKQFEMLTSPDNGLSDSITAELASIGQMETFVDEYRKQLQAQSLTPTP